MKKMLVPMLLCLLACSPSSACVDPDPDQMGIYFDQGATIYCTHAFMGNTVELYVVYTRPTLESFQGFEFGMAIEGGPGQLVWNWGNIIFIDPPELDNIRILFQDPIPTGVATVRGYRAVKTRAMASLSSAALNRPGPNLSSK